MKMPCDSSFKDVKLNIVFCRCFLWMSDFDEFNIRCSVLMVAVFSDSWSFYYTWRLVWMFLNETVPRTHARNTVARCLSLSGSAKLLVLFSSSCAHELLAHCSVSIILSELFLKLSFSVFIYFFPLHSTVYYRLPLVPHQHCPSCFYVSWGVEKL